MTGPPDYEVKTWAPKELGEETLARCAAIIRTGGAVPGSVKEEIALASALVIAHCGNEIVGVGTVKRIRTAYAAKIGKQSRATFDSNMPELGYVAVDPQHQGNRLSSRIVAELLSKHQGPLFATTDSERMKATLRKAGFVKKGREWNGRRGRLSLWVKGR